MRIIGIDTSLRSTGVGVVEMQGNSMKAVEYGILRISAAALLTECLAHLSREIGKWISRFKPDVAAIEGVFLNKNIKTALILGEARGAVIAACACSGLPVYEYAPRKIKQAVVGNGSAGKEQMRKMVAALLGLDKLPPEDAADALAVAICHLHNRTACEAIAPKKI